MKKLTKNNRTTNTLGGAARPIPSNLEELDELRQDSDGCEFTFQDMVNCGANPPAGTESHLFVIAGGDLCVYPPSGRKKGGFSNDMSHLWLGGSKWTEYRAWVDKCSGKS